jgi:HPt (histidine-containing phosphotransfer) domain-containing protein
LLDPAHLARQTAEDVHLQRELLALFRQHSPELMAQLVALGGARGEGEPPPDLQAMAHRLKGSALAIGAFPLVEVIDDAEKSFADAGATGPALARLADALEDALAAADLYIEELDARSPG